MMPITQNSGESSEHSMYCSVTYCNCSLTTSQEIGRPHTGKGILSMPPKELRHAVGVITGDLVRAQCGLRIDPATTAHELEMHKQALQAAADEAELATKREEEVALARQAQLAAEEAVAVAQKERVRAAAAQMVAEEQKDQMDDTAQGNALMHARTVRADTYTSRGGNNRPMSACTVPTYRPQPRSVVQLGMNVELLMDRPQTATTLFNRQVCKLVRPVQQLCIY